MRITDSPSTSIRTASRGIQVEECDRRTVQAEIKRQGHLEKRNTALHYPSSRMPPTRFIERLMRFGFANSSWIYCPFLLVVCDLKKREAIRSTGTFCSA